MRLRQSELTWHAAGEEVVVLDLNGSTYLKLNGSGRVLWEMLAESATEDELVAGLVEHFAISEDRARADVDGFVSALHARNLIED